MNELLVVPGEYDGSKECSIKVLGREVEDGVADATQIVARVRVKVVDEHVLVTIEREPQVEVLVRLP